MKIVEFYSLVDFHIQMNPLKEFFDILQHNLCQNLPLQSQWPTKLNMPFRPKAVVKEYLD